uniref:Uncharacterized protein n=1 Tax=Siphoviridae sp. ctbbV81 TaxID=2827900 RepID=A0A8S5TQK5_9CAUD|nr:MAG TPA: hypothetical protein [Siphoviridae sp. ctbbV81]
MPLFLLPVVLTGSFFIHTSTRTQKPILRIMSNFNALHCQFVVLNFVVIK